MSRTTLDALLADVPPAWPADLLPDIRRERERSGRKLVVLDDDPTGTQTVYDVPVLTEWSRETLERELSGDAKTVYLLTNSRSLPLEKAEALNRDVGARLREVSGALPLVISRGDSTLRGHYPGEVAALAGALGETYHATLLIPFFLEGGRYTLHDVHYVGNDVEKGGALEPVGETEFAKDATFGFFSSDLKAWVEEKTEGRIPAHAVASLSLADIREGGPDAVTERLLGVGGRTFIVNAAARRDLEVVALAALRAEGQGKRFLYRTAASFVQVLAGLAPRPPLSADVLTTGSGATGAGGGLVVVGSHVPKSTRQLEHLLAQKRFRHVEVTVAPLLDENTQEHETSRVVSFVERALAGGETVVVSTQRELLSSKTACGLSDLEIGRRVSESLVSVVRGVTTRPRFVIAKGGITSSDLATHGLGVKRALVRGQLLPGVPVWELGAKSRFPGLVYVVFPGNVGGDAALAQAVEKLNG